MDSDDTEGAERPPVDAKNMAGGGTKRRVDHERTLMEIEDARSRKVREEDRVATANTQGETNGAATVPQALTSPSQVTAIVCTFPATIIGAGSTRYHYTNERTGKGALHGHGQAEIYDRHLEARLSLTPGPPRRLGAGAIHSVAIIGGPCGGKSSAIIILRAMLTTIGFRVITVPEIATPMLYNTGGYEPSWQSTTKHVTLQTVFLKAQVAQEDAYRAIAALRPETPCVILHDRGALDGRSFCTRQEWASVIRAVGTSERSLYARYGLVLHLASTASEAQYERLYEYGTDSNNPSRFHNVEQAKEADRMSQKVYEHHPCYVSIGNYPSFEDKVLRTFAALVYHLAG